MNVLINPPCVHKIFSYFCAPANIRKHYLGNTIWGQACDFAILARLLKSFVLWPGNYEPKSKAESRSPADRVFGLPRGQFCGLAKNSRAVFAKEVLIVTGIEAGASVTELSNIIDLDTSNVSRRCDAAKLETETDAKLSYARNLVSKIYNEKIAQSQA